MRWCRGPGRLTAATLLLTAAFGLAPLAFNVFSGGLVPSAPRVFSVGHTAGLDGGVQQRGVEDTPRCSPLSIVCLAESPPTAAEWTRPEAALEALRLTPQHVVLAGHSRLRQVFEQLQPLLGATLRTRADRRPPLADRDDPRAPPVPDNGTCLAAVPKLKMDDMWCSMAADWGRLLLDFRWRSHTEPLSDLLDRLAARPPDRLVLTHGLYQASGVEVLLQLRAGLPPLVSGLQRLQRRGTATVTMLEAGGSAHARRQIVWNDDSVIIVNALLSELLLEGGVPLWSAHLPLTLDWLLRDCRRPPTDTEPECHDDHHVHTSPATNRRLVHQLLSVLTETGHLPA